MSLWDGCRPCRFTASRQRAASGPSLLEVINSEYSFECISSDIVSTGHNRPAALLPSFTPSNQIPTRADFGVAHLPNMSGSVVMSAPVNPYGAPIPGAAGQQGANPFDRPVDGFQRGGQGIYGRGAAAAGSSQRQQQFTPRRGSQFGGGTVGPGYRRGSSNSTTIAPGDNHGNYPSHQEFAHPHHLGPAFQGVLRPGDVQALIDFNRNFGAQQSVPRPTLRGEAFEFQPGAPVHAAQDGRSHGAEQTFTVFDISASTNPNYWVRPSSPRARAAASANPRNVGGNPLDQGAQRRGQLGSSYSLDLNANTSTTDGYVVRASTPPTAPAPRDADLRGSHPQAPALRHPDQSGAS